MKEYDPKTMEIKRMSFRLKAETKGLLPNPVEFEHLGGRNAYYVHCRTGKKRPELFHSTKKTDSSDSKLRAVWQSGKQPLLRKEIK